MRAPLLARTPEPRFHVVGEVEAPDPAKVTIHLSRTPKWQVAVSPTGEIDQLISARVETLVLEIGVAGDRQEYTVPVSETGVADLGKRVLSPMPRPVGLTPIE